MTRSDLLKELWLLRGSKGQGEARNQLGDYCSGGTAVTGTRETPWIWCQLIGFRMFSEDRANRICRWVQSWLKDDS